MGPHEVGDRRRMTIRVIAILGPEILAAITAWALAPWALIPGLTVGLFAGGWLSARPTDPPELHRRVARSVGAVNGVGVAIGWAWITAGDPEIGAQPVVGRAVLAGVLGVGAGLAALALSLIGLDARFIRPRA